MGQEFSLSDLTDALLSGIVSVENARRGRRRNSSDGGDDYWANLSPEQLKEAEEFWAKSGMRPDDGNRIRPVRGQVPMPKGVEPIAPRDPRLEDLDDDIPQEQYGHVSGSWDDDDEYAGMGSGSSWDEYVEDIDVGNSRRRKLLNARRLRNARQSVINRRACWKRYTSR